MEGLEREAAEFGVKEAAAGAGDGGAIVLVHGEGEHGDVGDKCEGHQPGEPGLGRRRVIARRRRHRQGLPDLERHRLDVVVRRLRRHPLPHCCGGGGGDGDRKAVHNSVGRGGMLLCTSC